MKIPRVPPDSKKLLAKLASEGARFVEILSLPQPDKYYHWDKLRHLDPPSGFTSEEWWVGVKFKRSSGMRNVPLKDTKGRAFQFMVPDEVLESLHRIDLGAGGGIGMPEQITNQQTRNQYFVRSLIQEAITSSQLEGAVTTREVAKEMIRSGRAPRDRSEQMVLNNYRTMRHLHKIRDRELTPELIFEIHRQVTTDTLDKLDAEGRFRKADEIIRVYDDEDNQVLHTPPDVEELPARLVKLCEFINDLDSKPFLHPVLRAIVAHFWLAYDHPFVDGNGRTARALFYWCMLKYDFWLFEFISISSVLREAPKSYARSFLYTETDENDLTYFIVYQIEVIERAVKALHDYIDRKSRELKETQIQIRSFAEFNHRQQSVLNHALKHPYEEYTIEGHGRSCDVAYQTARTDLLGLAEKKILIKKKRGRKSVFAVAPNLSSLLRDSSVGL